MKSLILIFSLSLITYTLFYVIILYTVYFNTKIMSGFRTGVWNRRTCPTPALGNPPTSLRRPPPEACVWFRILLLVKAHFPI